MIEWTCKADAVTMTKTATCLVSSSSTKATALTLESTQLTSEIALTTKRLLLFVSFVPNESLVVTSVVVVDQGPVPVFTAFADIGEVSVVVGLVEGTYGALAVVGLVVAAVIGGVRDGVVFSIGVS